MEQATEGRSVVSRDGAVDHLGCHPTRSPGPKVNCFEVVKEEGRKQVRRSAPKVVRAAAFFRRPLLAFREVRRTLNLLPIRWRVTTLGMITYLRKCQREGSAAIAEGKAVQSTHRCARR